MRQAIIDYLKEHKRDLTPLIVSEQLPYSPDDSQPLYMKNKKHIYVDLDQVNQVTALNALDGSGATNEHTNVRAFFVTDAKQPIPNYETVVQVIKDARLTAGLSYLGVTQRLVTVTTRYDVDAVITEFEYHFVRLIPQ